MYVLLTDEQINGLINIVMNTTFKGNECHTVVDLLGRLKNPFTEEEICSAQCVPGENSDC